MKTTTFFLIFFIASLIYLSACNQRNQRAAGTTSAQTEEQLIRDIIAQVGEGKRELAYTDDVYYNTGRYSKPIVGRQQLEAESGEVTTRSPRPNQKTVNNIQKLVVAQAGDMAYEHGIVTISFDSAANARASFNSSYLRVWRKVGDEWKVGAHFARPIE